MWLSREVPEYSRQDLTTSSQGQVRTRQACPGPRGAPSQVPWVTRMARWAGGCSVAEVLCQQELWSPGAPRRGVPGGRGGLCWY